MTHGTLIESSGRPTLRFERTVTHPVTRVWRAISTRDELEQWFPAAVDWTPAVGEVIEAYGMTGEVTEVELDRRLAWTFNGDAYSFDLEPDGEGSRVVFLHAFDDRSAAAQTAAGWDSYFDRLQPLLDGAPLTEEEAHASWPENHEHYASEFGIDPTPGREFWARHTAASGTSE